MHYNNTQVTNKKKTIRQAYSNTIILLNNIALKTLKFTINPTNNKTEQSLLLIPIEVTLPPN